MKAHHTGLRHGLTLIEVLVVIAILIILAGLIGPPPPSATAKANQITCLNNLKNMGLALRVFAADHGDEFPMALSLTNGGTREWLSDETRLWRHWRVLSNELGSVRFLLCPSDSERQLPSSFMDKRPVLTRDQFTNNSHLSYFLALNPRPDEPQSILAGDRNLTTNGVPFGPGRLTLSSELLIGFTTKPHKQAGNIVLADGSVRPALSPQFNDAWTAARTNSRGATNVWLVP